MKEDINKLVELALMFAKLANGNDCDYSGDKIQVYFTDNEEPMVTFNDIVEVVFWKENRTNTEFNIRDISRLSEIPEIISECKAYLEDVKNFIKVS